MKIDECKLKTLPLTAKYFDVLDSTSLYLKRQIHSGEKPFELVIAGEQTNGQGRIGRSFYSPCESGLYLTFCCSGLEMTEHLTPRIALAVTSVIDDVFQTKTTLKWVNDVYLDGKKIAGILCQQINEYTLIGIGINLYRPNVIPKELEERLGFVTEKGDNLEPIDLIYRLYQSIQASLVLKKETVLSHYRKKCNHLGRPVTIEYNNCVLSGTCLAINDDFSLAVEFAGEIRSFSSGFVSLKL